MNKHEILQALLDGKKLQHLTWDVGKYIFMDKMGDIRASFTCPWGLDQVLSRAYWYVYKEPKWYEDIPGKGILCWVSDDEIRDSDKNLKDTFLSIVNYHFPGEEYPFGTSGIEWKYAEPWKTEDFEGYVLEQG